MQVTKELLKFMHQSPEFAITPISDDGRVVRWRSKVENLVGEDDGTVVQWQDAEKKLVVEYNRDTLQIVGKLYEVDEQEKWTGGALIKDDMLYKLIKEGNFVFLWIEKFLSPVAAKAKKDGIYAINHPNLTTPVFVKRGVSIQCYLVTSENLSIWKELMEAQAEEEGQAAMRGMQFGWDALDVQEVLDRKRPVFDYTDNQRKV